MPRGLVTFSIWACCLLVTGVSSQSAFSTPPAPGPNLNFLNNQIYAIGELLNIQYCQDVDALYNINLWQQGNTVDETPFVNLTDQGCVEKPWTISTNQDLCQGNVFFLSLDDDTNVGFNSHYFNLTHADGSICPASSSSISDSSSTTHPTTSTTASSTAFSSSPSLTSTPAVTVTQSTQPTAQRSAQPTDQSSAQPTVVKNSGLPTAAAIGIGAACGLLGCIALYLGAFLVLRWWRRQKSKQKQSAAERSGSALGYKNHIHAMTAEYAEYPQYPRKYEMDAQPAMGLQLQKHELDSSDRQR